MNRKIMKLAGMLVLTVCLFLSPAGQSTKAKTIPADRGMMLMSADDIPEEITAPIEKGKQLLAYLVMSLGAIAALVGIVFLGIAFLGHQPDMRIQGFIFLGVGFLLFAAPIVINWMLGKSLF